MIVMYLLIGAWIIVLSVDFAFSMRKKHKSAKNAESTLLTGQATHQQALSINSEESVLIGGKLGEVRITFLSSVDDGRIRLGITAPRTMKVYRREKDRNELVSDQKLNDRELLHWRDELRRNDKERREREQLLAPRVDKDLLEGKSMQQIAGKCQVSIDFVAKRYSVLEKAGSFETPLFDIK